MTERLSAEHVAATKPDDWRMCAADYPEGEAPLYVQLLRLPFARYWRTQGFSNGPPSYRRPGDAAIRSLWAAAYVKHAELLDAASARCDTLEECLSDAAEAAGLTPAGLILGVSPEFEDSLVRKEVEWVQQADGSTYEKTLFHKNIDWVKRAVVLAPFIDLPLLRTRTGTPAAYFMEHTPYIRSEHIVMSLDSQRRFSAEDCRVLETRGISLEEALAYPTLNVGDIITAIDMGYPVEYAERMFEA